jgi:hypothetical protein
MKCRTWHSFSAGTSPWGRIDLTATWVWIIHIPPDFYGKSADLLGFPVLLQRALSYVCKTSRDSGIARDIAEHLCQIIWRDINLTRLVLMFKKFEDLCCGWSIAWYEGAAACDEVPQGVINTAPSWT